MSATFDLAADLIRRPSVTPLDEGCQAVIASRLTDAGFSTESFRFGAVTNLWARLGGKPPLFVFAGHTDVVPAGPVENWSSPPFEPAVRDGYLYGRGAADMKGSLAAMVTGTERFIARHAPHTGSIAFLITSDEEGPAEDGTVRVVQRLGARGEEIDWCLVGEPSSVHTLGDTVKHGRRGSLNGPMLVRGVQGHVAYPERANNPIHRIAPALSELIGTRWDRGDDLLPATSFQVSNVHAGTGADNVIPGALTMHFNFRYSTAVTPQHLQARVDDILGRHDVDYEIHWQPSGNPFITRGGVLVDAVLGAISDTVGIEAELSTAGGTSDGRFIAPTGAQVVEFGPLNATIHKIDECVRVQDLDTLSLVYERVLERLFAH